MPGCRSSHVVDPARHELAGAPHIHFRISDIRQEALEQPWFQFRLRLDRTVDGLIPFVIVTEPGRLGSAWLLRRHSLLVWDFGINISPPFGPDARFRIYLTTIE